MSAARSIIGFVAGVGVILGVAVVTLWRRPASLAIQDVVDVGMVLPMVAVTVPVPIRNQHPLRSATLKELSSSCQCTLVDSGPRVIRPWSSETLDVVVKPGKHERIVEAQIFLTLDDGYTSRLIVRGKVLSPFEGWPDRAAVALEGGAALLAVDPRFLDLVAGGVCHIPGRDAPIRVIVDRDRRRLVIVGDVAIPTDGTAELVLSLLTPESATWSGWIIGHDGALELTPSKGDSR
ncbi:MAG: hypothetical protein FJ255_00240 [Phycisphaerae bacterium]|nr:hypothetical protein [Phycisphaerae bacterium]